jgi:hypothetical protein
MIFEKASKPPSAVSCWSPWYRKNVFNSPSQKVLDRFELNEYQISYVPCWQKYEILVPESYAVLNQARKLKRSSAITINMLMSMYRQAGRHASELDNNYVELA